MAEDAEVTLNIREEVEREAVLNEVKEIQALADFIMDNVEKGFIQNVSLGEFNGKKINAFYFFLSGDNVSGIFFAKEKRFKKEPGQLVIYGYVEHKPFRNPFGIRKGRTWIKIFSNYYYLKEHDRLYLSGQTLYQEVTIDQIFADGVMPWEIKRKFAKMLSEKVKRTRALLTKEREVLVKAKSMIGAKNEKEFLAKIEEQCHE